MKRLLKLRLDCVSLIKLVAILAVLALAPNISLAQTKHGIDRVADFYSDVRPHRAFIHANFDRCSKRWLAAVAASNPGEPLVLYATGNDLFARAVSRYLNGLFITQSGKSVQDSVRINLEVARVAATNPATDTFGIEWREEKLAQICLGELFLGGSSGAAANSALDGDWQGVSSGNKVSILSRATGIDVAALGTLRPGQTDKGSWQKSGSGYEYTFPNGQKAVLTILGPNSIRVTNPDGWTDTFNRIGGAPAPAPAPAAGGSNGPLGDNPKLGPETQKVLSDIMAPGAPGQQSFFDGTDFKALAEGRPSNATSRQRQAAANANHTATKTRKLHNRLNDVTPCLAVDPTGVREEWGMEGRYRIRNTCSFPVEASWCANKSECTTGRGSTWKLPPKGVWPIFFADLANPQIGIGGCRTEENRIPLPSDAALSAAGGINTSHKPPIPYPGVTILPGHRCD